MPHNVTTVPFCTKPELRPQGCRGHVTRAFHETRGDTTKTKPEGLGRVSQMATQSFRIQQETKLLAGRSLHAKNGALSLIQFESFHDTLKLEIGKDHLE